MAGFKLFVHSNMKIKNVQIHPFFDTDHNLQQDDVLISCDEAS